MLGNVWGGETCPFSGNLGIGGDSEVGDPTMDFWDFWDFCVATMETGVLLSLTSDARGTGFTQSGGGPTEREAGSTVPG